MINMEIIIYNYIDIQPKFIPQDYAKILDKVFAV
jgi:hypothetical protein